MATQLTRPQYGGLYDSRPRISREEKVRKSVRRRPRIAFILMHDRKGWQSLTVSQFGLNTDYLRLPESSDVDVDKGTLVEIDPNSHFDPMTNISVIVVSLDRPEVKLNLLMKELMVIEEESFDRLLPLKPHERYRLLTDDRLLPILHSQIGDTVWCCNENRQDVGMIQYIGPVEGLGDGHWFGVELLDSYAGTCDGVFGHRRYFSAPPCSSVFVSVSHLWPYENFREDKKAFHNGASKKQYGNKKSPSPDIAKLTIVEGIDPDLRQKTNQQKAYISSNYVDDDSSSDENNHKSMKQLVVGERIIWITDQGPEPGTVKWIGFVPERKKALAGVEFDHPVGSGDGTYKDKRLFKAKRKHASLVPLEGLIREKDYDYRSTPSWENQHKPLPNAKTVLSPTEENYLNELTGAQADISNQLSSIPNYCPRNEVSSGDVPPYPPPRRSQDKRSSPRFDKIEASEAVNEKSGIELGSLVELRLKGFPMYGVVRWIGWLPEEDKKGVGIELEEEIAGGTNGWHFGSQLFACPNYKGVFVPFGYLKVDTRFDDSAQDKDPQYETFGRLECPVLPGLYAPIEVSKVSSICGQNKGIQGHKNSCYLDATLFAMFSFSCVFDSLLYRPATSDDIPEYKDVQKVLREEIVNPLRKNIFVRADRVMKLRKFLDHLTSIRGLLSEEKDPEEFLNSLLTQTLKANPFLQLSSGQSSHLYQLFVERDESLELPTVQQLFEQSFLTSNIKLKRVPSVLILQMPRFGRQFKVYDRILPSQYLDVTDIIENSPRQCIICGKVATFECLNCFKEHSSGLDSTAFCDICIGPVHNHHKRKSHKMNALSIPKEFIDKRCGTSTSRLYMELFAVVCIETSHYVSFVKCGTGPDASWCFFDSMADRKGEVNGYNIPEVSPAENIPKWFEEEGIRFLKGCKEDKHLPLQAKRFVCDGYMCFYQSPEVMMYE